MFAHAGSVDLVESIRCKKSQSETKKESKGTYDNLALDVATCQSGWQRRLISESANASLLPFELVFPLQTKKPTVWRFIAKYNFKHLIDLASGYCIGALSF
jgi:hypothetical protein